MYLKYVDKGYRNGDVLTKEKRKRGTEIIGDYIDIYSEVPKEMRAKRGIPIYNKLKKY